MRLRSLCVVLGLVLLLAAAVSTAVAQDAPPPEKAPVAEAPAEAKPQRRPWIIVRRLDGGQATWRDGAALEADSVVWSDRGFVFVAAAGTALRLEDKDGRLHGTDAAGTRSLLAVRFDDASAPSLAALSDAQVRALRGVWFRSSAPGAAAFVARIDPERCAVRVCDASAASLAMLPAGLRHLFLDDVHGDGANLEDLGRHSGLQSLVFGYGFDDAVGWEALAGLGSLRVLDAPANAVPLLAAGRFPDLRSLKLAWSSGVDSLEFLRGVPKLRSLDVVYSEITDLRPLALCPALEEADLSFAPVTHLPDAPLPSLRRARIVGHHADAEDVAAFVAANPRCRVEHDLRALFVERTAGATQISVERDDEVLWSSRRAEEIAGFVDLVRVDDRSAIGGLCHCFGSAYIIIRGPGPNEGVAVNVHHASRITGLGAGLLTLEPKSAERIAAWLAVRGDPSQAKLLADEREKAALQRARDRLQTEILGEELTTRLRAPDAPRDVLPASVPDPVARFTLAVRLIGAAADEDEDAVSAAAWRVLADPPEDALVRSAIERAEADPVGALGVALARIDSTFAAATDEERAAAAQWLLAKRDPRLRKIAACAAGTSFETWGRAVLRDLIASWRPGTSPGSAEREAAETLAWKDDDTDAEVLRAIGIASGDEGLRAYFEECIARRSRR